MFRAYDRTARAASGADAVSSVSPNPFHTSSASRPFSASRNPPLAIERTFAPSGKARLAARFRDLLRAGADPVLAARIRLVMEHFDILKSVIAEEGGAVVKTIGDAVMAVFPRPQSAVRAALESHRRLRESQPLLILKTGVHCGSCIAVNQNDRLDYFGSTLNLSARLLGFSEGGDLVVTREAGRDPETAARLESHGSGFRIDDLRTPIRGFERESFDLMRITPLPPATAPVPAAPGYPASIAL